MFAVIGSLVMISNHYTFLLELSKEEQWLIQELYFEERTEREVKRQFLIERLRKLISS